MSDVMLLINTCEEMCVRAKGENSHVIAAVCLFIQWNCRRLHEIRLVVTHPYRINAPAAVEMLIKAQAVRV